MDRSRWVSQVELHAVELQCQVRPFKMVNSCCNSFEAHRPFAARESPAIPFDATSLRPAVEGNGSLDRIRLATQLKTW